MGNCTENRPWGSFTILDEGDGFKVKRISVKPGEKLSLQYHHHRSEHWTVVQGEATVTIGDTTKPVSINETAYIPLKEKHALANEGQEFVDRHSTAAPTEEEKAAYRQMKEAARAVGRGELASSEF